MQLAFPENVHQKANQKCAYVYVWGVEYTSLQPVYISDIN